MDDEYRLVDALSDLAALEFGDLPPDERVAACRRIRGLLDEIEKTAVLIEANA